MSELRESLDEAMRAVIPGEPPVDAAMRRGKAIRRRRWVAAVASAVAVAVVAAAGYPAVTHWRATQAPPPVTHGHHAGISDVPPGRDAAPGLVASGVIGKQSWQVLVSKPGKLGTAQNQQCVYTQGSAFATGITANPSTASMAQECGPVLAPGTDPVTFTGVSAGPYQAQVGAVAADVRYVVVRLGDGQRLKLVPVRVYGTRLVAFAAPLASGVASATAYLANGQYLTAIPANLPAGLPVFGKWLRPGQPVPPRATAVIASGTVDGQPWSVTAYVGPWGTCFGAAGESACMAVVPTTATGHLGYAGGSPRWVYGSAAASVSHLIVLLTDGRSFRVGVVPVDGEKLFAFALGKGQTLDRWTAYDAAGKEVSSGVL
jgi:hypothetical protein